MFHRRQPDPAVEAAWESFCRFARRSTRAAALPATVPTARRQGVPLDAAVAGFLAGLDAARAELPGWAHPAVAAERAKAAAALSAAEQAAHRLPADAHQLGFEQRNQRLAAVLDELVDVEPAEAAPRSLRRRTADQPS
jgi:hypothetical protein